MTVRDTGYAYRMADVKSPSHGHVDCPACGERLYFGTDHLGRTTVKCYPCQTESYLPLYRDPPTPKTQRQLPKSARG